MRITLLAGVWTLLFVIEYAEASAWQSSVASHQTVLTKYCVTCHNEKLRTAGLLLDKADIDHPADNPEIWEKVIRKLRTREMPPARMPRPDDATYESVAKYLESALDQAAAARPNPGRPTVYRLLRFCRPMIPDTASTTSATCSPCRRCSWRNIFRPQRPSAVWPSAIVRSVRRRRIIKSGPTRFKPNAKRSIYRSVLEVELRSGTISRWTPSTSSKFGCNEARMERRSSAAPNNVSWIFDWMGHG